VLEPADHERGTQYQQEVCQHRTDQRGLHHGEQPRAQREERDEQLGKVAQRALQHAGGAGAEAVAQLFHAAPDQRSEQRHGDGGAAEREHRVRL
jgi:hypothetical protein